MMKKGLLTLFGAACIVAGSQAQTFEDVTIWEDTAPSGGNMALVTVPDPSGAGYGDVGEWDSNRGGQYENYGSPTENWSAYAGKDYTLSCEVYLTAAQAADPAILDDTFYSQVAGSAKTWKSVGSFTPDAWNTYTRTGTFTPNPDDLTSIFGRILINDKGTHPTNAPNLYVDNFKLVVHDVEITEPDPTDVVWDDRAPEGGGVSLNVTADPFGTGHGNIGEYISSDVGQYANYNPGNQDWSAYAGQPWTLSVDVYLTAAQFADPNITDNDLYISVGAAGSTGWKSIADVGAADAWSTVTWTGVFDSDPNVLTNVNALILNNHKATHPLAGADYYFDNFKLEVTAPERDALWEEPNPAFFTVVTNAFGDGIGEYDSSTGSQWDNYGTYNNDWTAYVGKDWKFSFEIYLTSNQLADAAIADDNFFYSVAGDSGGYITISENEFVADAWNTVQWFGSFSDDVYALTNVFARISNNDQLTHPVTAPNFYTRNFKLEATPVYVAPPVYIDVTNTVEFVAAEGFVNGSISGQVGWVESNTNGYEMTVDASAGTATATNDNVNMTLLDPIGGLIAGDTVKVIVDFAFDGVSDMSGTNDNYSGYFMNMGLTIQDTGEALGAENPLADILRIQRLYKTNTSNTTVRLLQNGYNGATAEIADIADGDELQIIYQLTVGADAGASFVEATLTNITQGVGAVGSSYAVGATNLLYDALVSTNGGGAYVYVEAGSMNYVSGLEVDTVTYVYPKLYVEYDTPYDQWKADNNVVGDWDQDDDNDGLNNFGEYVFGGLPKISSDQGTIPAFDAASGDYAFSVVGDDSLTITVWTNVNLTIESLWGVHETIPVTSTSAALEDYTSSIGSGNDQVFMKLDVNRN